MNGSISGHSFQVHCDLHQFFSVTVTAKCSEFCIFFQGFFQGHIQKARNSFYNSIYFTVGKTHYSAYVTHNCAGGHGTEGDDLSYVLLSVSPSYVFNYFVIINTAVTNYFVKNIPVEDTINGCNELIQFQKICRVSSSYNYAMHGTTKMPGKTFRVFASKELTDGGMFKVKAGGNPEKFANTSLNCFIVNGDVNGLTVPDKLDKEFYIGMARRHVNQFLYGKE